MRPRVAILASTSAREAALTIVDTLMALGVQARLGAEESGDTAILVIVSEGAGEDEEFCAAMARVGTARKVPVALGYVEAPWLPSELSELNWIIWDSSDPVRCGLLIRQASFTDVQEYRRFQSLIARAEGWSLGGRQMEATLQRADELRDAQTNTAIALANNGQRQLIDQFIVASSKALSKRRKKRILNNTLRLLLTFSLAVGMATYVRYLISIREESLLLTLAAQTDYAGLLPAAQTIKVAALIDHQLSRGATPNRMETTALTRWLSTPMPSGTGNMSPLGKWLNGAAFLGDGPQQVFAGTDGNVWKGDLTSGRDMNSIARVSDEPLNIISASRLGDTIVTASRSNVYIVRPTGTQRLAIKGTATRAAVSANGNTAAVATSEGIVPVDLSHGNAHLRAVLPVTQLLALTATSDKVIALVHRDGELVVLDLDTGATIRSLSFPNSPLMSGALAESGHVAASGADGQIWVAQPSGPLAASGAFVPDITRTVAITDEGVVYYAGDGIGVRAYDSKVRMRLHDTCLEGVTHQVLLTPKGAWIDCFQATRHVLYRTEKGQYEPPEPVIQTQWPVVSKSGRVKSLDRDPAGLLLVRSANGTQPLQLSNLGAAFPPATEPGMGDSPVVPSARPSLIASIGVGPPTAAAISADGQTIAVGLADGTVVEVDVLADGSFQQVSNWRSPDGAEIRSLHWAQGSIVIDSQSATWRARSCAGCGNDSRLLIAHAVELRQPCYERSIAGLVPSTQIRHLQISLCPINPGEAE